MKYVNKEKFVHKSVASQLDLLKQQAKFLMGSALVVLSFVSVVAQAAVLQDIKFSGLPGNKVQIELLLDSEPGELKSFSTNNPARISLDLLGVTNASGKRTTSINIGKVVSVRALEAGNKTRVVLNLNDTAPYSTKVVGNSVFLTLGHVPGLVPAKEARKAVAIGAAVGGKSVSDIDFRRGEKGEGRVLVKLTSASVVDVRREGNNVIVDIKDTALRDGLANRLDVLDFATPVKTIEASSFGKGTRLNIAAIGGYEFLSYQMDELLTIEFKHLTKQKQEELAAEKFEFQGEKLSLNFQSIEVRSVLQLLADFTDMNLVTSDSVTGSVTLRLNNVPWDQALDIILKSKNLDKRVNGNVIMVGLQAEIIAQEKLELEAQKEIIELAPLRTEFFAISYAKALDLVDTLNATSSDGASDSGSSGLISDRGSVSVDERTNTLLIQETSAKLVEIREIIERLDKPLRQVMIESRIVVANDDFTRDLGVRFGVSGVDRSGPGGLGDSRSLIGGGLPGIVTPAGGPIFGVGGTENLMVDLAAENPAGAVQFLVGKIGSSLLQLELSALQSEKRGEVISSPRVITSDQQEATISQGVQIPYQEASSSGATTTSFKDAFLDLTVTPRITPDDKINLEIIVSKDSPGVSDRGQEVAINVQKVETTVLVDDGNTVILGGVYEKNKSNNVKKVPFFGDLPGVGVLFKNESKVDENRELLFFITPKILRENGSIN